MTSEAFSFDPNSPTNIDGIITGYLHGIGIDGSLYQRTLTDIHHEILLDNTGIDGTFTGSYIKEPILNARYWGEQVNSGNVEWKNNIEGIERTEYNGKITVRDNVDVKVDRSNSSRDLAYDQSSMDYMVTFYDESGDDIVDRIMITEDGFGYSANKEYNLLDKNQNGFFENIKLTFRDTDNNLYPTNINFESNKDDGYYNKLEVLNNIIEMGFAGFSEIEKSTIFTLEDKLSESGNRDSVFDSFSSTRVEEGWKLWGFRNIDPTPDIKEYVIPEQLTDFSFRYFSPEEWMNMLITFESTSEQK